MYTTGGGGGGGRGFVLNKLKNFDPPKTFFLNPPTYIQTKYDPPHPPMFASPQNAFQMLYGANFI